MAFFSVIIPVYNKQNFVYKTIQSVLSQTFSDFEIIIINDGSTDESENEILKFSDKRINYFKQKNSGLSATRNLGIKNGVSDFLVFLDADDIWEIGFLDKIHSLVVNFPEAKIYATNYYEVYPNGLKMKPKTTLNFFDKDGLIKDYFKASLGQPIYCFCCLCIHKSVFKTIGLFNENITYGEDIDFNIRANLKFKVAYSSTAFANYSVFSENQITNSSFKNKITVDFLTYEKENLNDLSLKKYLDFNRYLIAKKYKIIQDKINYNRMKSEIDFNNLNYKQLFLLFSPLYIEEVFSKIKSYLLKKGVRLSSYTKVI